MVLAGGGIDLYGTDRLNHTPRLRKGKAIGVSSGDSGWQTQTATTDGTFNPLNFHGEFTRDEAMGKGIDRLVYTW